MSEHQENSIVHAVEPLTDSFHRLTLHAPLIAATAQPGQFVMVACGPSLDPLLRRPFSIHRRIGAEQIQLLFKVVGRGTRLLSELRPGQTLSLIGPLGRGFGPVPADSVCLVGGGIGIAPLLFLADRWHRSAMSCTVLLGSRTGDELTHLAAEFEALGCRIEIATDDGSLGHHGLVTDLLAPHLTQIKKVYVCGPHAMMATVAELCKTSQVACEASLEAHMACGLGACLGCTIHGADTLYKHVCKHGPVFNAEEVAWNR